MKKIKNIASIVGVILALCTVLGFFATLFPVLPTVETPSKYAITYRAVHGGMIENIHEDMWKDGGNYPTYYIQGEETEIDDLKSYVSVSSTHDLDFGGWYWDVKFENEFNGITEEMSGDLTIYAKITDGYWTANY